MMTTGEVSTKKIGVATIVLAILIARGVFLRSFSNHDLQMASVALGRKVIRDKQAPLASFFVTLKHTGLNTGASGFSLGGIRASYDAIPSNPHETTGWEADILDANGNLLGVTTFTADHSVFDSPDTAAIDPITLELGFPYNTNAATLKVVSQTNAADIWMADLSSFFAPPPAATANARVSLATLADATIEVGQTVTVPVTVNGDGTTPITLSPDDISAKDDAERLTFAWDNSAPITSAGSASAKLNITTGPNTILGSHVVQITATSQSDPSNKDVKVFDVTVGAASESGSTPPACTPSQLLRDGSCVNPPPPPPPPATGVGKANPGEITLTQSAPSATVSFSVNDEADDGMLVIIANGLNISDNLGPYDSGTHTLTITAPLDIKEETSFRFCMAVSSLAQCDNDISWQLGNAITVPVHIDTTAPVVPAPPSPSIVFDATIGATARSVNLFAQALNFPECKLDNYTWDFGDGTRQSAQQSADTCPDPATIGTVVGGYTHYDSTTGKVTRVGGTLVEESPIIPSRTITISHTYKTTGNYMIKFSLGSSTASLPITIPYPTQTTPKNVAFTTGNVSNTVSWQTVAGADYYQVWGRDSSTGQTILLKDNVAPSYSGVGTYSFLTIHSPYYITVTA